ncbi:MAG TPA: hypothetical protein VK806_09630 [Bacteroidia bacterium]|jgi:hypothetical protein|nr:hypothetical protein [Bacteroidia bacterium]
MNSKNKIAVVAIALSMMVISCGHKTTFKEIDINNQYTISVPAYMQVTNELLPGIASLQYENDSAKLYLLVIDTARSGMREGSLKAFYDSAVAQPALESAQITPAKFKMLGGDSAYTSEMTGAISGQYSGPAPDSMKMFYKIEVVGSADRFYQILIWSQLSRAEDLKGDMDKVLASFHDIHR